MSPATIQTHPPAFYVPSVDIGPYLSDPSSPEADIIIEKIRAACLSTGFFQITNHGISSSVQDSIFNAAKKFFALPYEEKLKLDVKTTVGHRGYDAIASQSYEEGVLPDLKEGFFVGQDIPADDERVRARRFFMGPNVWPSSQLLPVDAFQEPVEEYFAAVHALTIKMLEMVARTLPYGPHIFDKFVANDPTTPLRLLRYPPAQKTESRQLGASAHTDFGALTLLLQDGTSGLQVLDSATDNWIPIAPDRGGYVVNLGDMLSLWTGGLYKSSIHRVMNENPKDRYSVVFFFDGNLDCPLTPFDGSNVKGKALTVEDHMVKRMTESYGKK